MTIEHRPADSADESIRSTPIGGAANAFAGVPDAIVATDADWRITAWNPAAERIFGIAAADALGRTMQELTEVETISATTPLETARDVIRRVGRWTGRTMYRVRRSARTVIADAEIATIGGPDAGFGGVVAVLRDVTASARLEAAFGAIASLAADEPDPAHLAAATLRVLSDTTGCSMGVIVTTEPGATMRIVAQEGLEIDIGGLLRDRAAPGTISRAIDTGDPVMFGRLADLQLDERAQQRLAAQGIAQVAIISLRGSAGSYLGLAWSEGVPPPAPMALRQAGILIGGALEQARQLEAVRLAREHAERLVRRLNSLVDIARLPDDAPSPTGRDEQLTRRTMELLEADAAVMADIVDDHLVVRTVANLPPDLARLLVDLPILHVQGDDVASGHASPQRYRELPPGADPEKASPFFAAGYQVLLIIPVNLGGRLARLAIFWYRDPDAGNIDAPDLRPVAHILQVAVANELLATRLRASETRYRDLFEDAPDAILVQTLDGRIAAANRAAETVFGRSRATLLGLTASELALPDGPQPPLPPEQHARSAEPGAPSRSGEPGAASPAGETVVHGLPDAAGELAAHGVLATDGPRHFVGIRADGTRFPLEAHSALVELDGEPRVMLQLHDLTERERTHDQLLQAQKMEAIGALVGGVRHELNNPLTAVRGYAELIATDPYASDTTREDARRIRDAGERAISLVQTFADFARERPSAPDALDLRDVVDGVLALLRFDFMQPLRPRSSSGVAVTVTLPPDLPQALADRGRVEQILVTLLQNALDAFRAHAAHLPDPIGVVGRIEISAEVVGDRLRCRIRDDGPGIAATMQGRLFTPFVSTKPNGRGLGLWVAARLAAANAGSLAHETPREGGAAFVLELPLAGLEGHADRQSATSAIPSPGIELRGPAAPYVPRERPVATRILIAEDEPEIRQLYQRILASQPWHLELAVDGEQALEMARAEPFDFVLLDHRMPGISGAEAYRRLVAAEPRYRGRIALVSANETDPELEALAAAEGVDILDKIVTVTTSALAARLQALIERAAQRG